jgi:hypothetical protein
VLNAFFGNSKYIPENNEILVTSSRISSRVDQFAMQMGRPASKEEIKGFIDKYIHEEVLSREAKLLGLDNDDIVIRRRLVQKMEFMSDEFLVAAEPTPTQLEGFFEDSREAYIQPATVSFYQVYINSQDLTEQEVIMKATGIKNNFEKNEQTPEQSYNYGDRTMLSNQFTKVTYEKVFHSFGDEEFIESLKTAPFQEWVGPFKSTYGHHLIYINERIEPSIPEFHEVASRVIQDYMDFKKEEANDEFFTQMRARYIVNMDEELKSVYNEE